MALYWLKLAYVYTTFHTKRYGLKSLNVDTPNTDVTWSRHKNVRGKVKQSHYRPGVAQRVSGS